MLGGTWGPAPSAFFQSGPGLVRPALHSKMLKQGPDPFAEAHSPALSWEELGLHQVGTFYVFMVASVRPQF